MARFTLAAPVKKSSDSGSKRVTVKALEITRGRDREWKRPDNVVYFAAYTSRQRAEAGRASMVLALDYADARQLVRLLREELKLERDYAIRISKQRQDRDV